MWGFKGLWSLFCDAKKYSDSCKWRDVQQEKGCCYLSHFLRERQFGRKLLSRSNMLNYHPNQSHFRNSLHLEMLSMKQGLLVSWFPPAPFVIVPINDLSCTNLNLLYCVLSCVPFRKSWRFKINGTPGETMEELHRGWTCMGQAHNLSLCFFPASRSSYFLRSASDTCWHQVSESLGLNVPISQGHKFLRSQGLSVWYS